MSKNIGSIFFTLIFVSFLMAPTVIRMIDNSVDISVFYTTTSEEGEKGSEKVKDVEILFFELNHNLEGETHCLNNNKSDYYFKSYPKPHLNLISPPPENVL